MPAELLDIRVEKNKLREQYKNIRANIENKEAKDLKIKNKLSNLWAYREAERVFAYVSMGTEVSTFEIIKMSLQKGKKVAVPYCVPGTRELRFYYINSLDDLESGTFGVLEPKRTSARLPQTTAAFALFPDLPLTALVIAWATAKVITTDFKQF